MENRKIDETLAKVLKQVADQVQDTIESEQKGFEYSEADIVDLIKNSPALN